MSLCSDTIDGPASSNPLLDIFDHALGLAVVKSLFDSVVVVDIKLRTGISLTGRFECNTDEVLAEDFGENGISETSILVKHFVNDVPLQNLSLISSDLRADMGLND